jgi:pimeloyl-ACP methyl ester carboxylesterase
MDTSSLGRIATREITVPDGRVLTVEVSGAGSGSPVFLLHGTPGSRNGPKPRGSLLYRLGVQLICYDRPGYGGSTRHEGRRVADAAADIAAIADALGLDAFAVVGRSGGGPHALACAALLPDRVARTAVLVSLAHPEATDLDWFAGMNTDNVREFRAARDDEASLIENLRRRADATLRDPESLVDVLATQMTEPDRRIVSDVSIRRMLASTYLEALRDGPYGWIDDVLALRVDWGFAMDAVECPVRLWHGEQDNFSPASHTRWLASRIPGAELQVQSGSAHFGAVEILPDILAWCAADRGLERVRVDDAPEQAPIA